MLAYKQPLNRTGHVNQLTHLHSFLIGCSETFPVALHPSTAGPGTCCRLADWGRFCHLLLSLPTSRPRICFTKQSLQCLRDCYCSFSLGVTVIRARQFAAVDCTPHQGPILLQVHRLRKTHQALPLPSASVASQSSRLDATSRVADAASCKWFDSSIDSPAGQPVKACLLVLCSAVGLYWQGPQTGSYVSRTY